MITDTLPARVVPVRESQVRPQVSGIVRERLFTEGDDVEAGQPLYRIDPDIFRADLDAARSQLARSEAALALARTEATRTEKLAERGISTGSALDSAQTQLALARAEVRASRAAVQRSRINLDYTDVVAPIAGRIGISRVTEGALVSAGDPQPMTLIQQIDTVYVDARQPLGRYQELKRMLATGELQAPETDEVALFAMDGEELPVTGRFLFTDATVDPVSNEVTLRITVDNEDLALLPNMFVRARVAAGIDDDAILIPQQAVRHSATFGANVMVIDAEDHVRVRPVSYGRVIDGRYLMTSGVEPGDRVIVEGQSSLRPDMPVQPTEWQSTLPSHEQE